MRQHYRKVGITKGWERKRFYTLCKVSQILPEEMAAFIGLKPCELKTMLRNNKFSAPASLLLAIIEGAVFEAKGGDKWELPMPFNLLKK